MAFLKLKSTTMNMFVAMSVALAFYMSIIAGAKLGNLREKMALLGIFFRRDIHAPTAIFL